mmetsp:Transcript_17453/g.37830  ORF Transcript_17453/g.37830 Transcript_17453/m.37830 type:complete len:490 (+) Transcript_17453:371-1840(+)
MSSAAAAAANGEAKGDGTTKQEDARGTTTRRRPAKAAAVVLMLLGLVVTIALAGLAGSSKLTRRAVHVSRSQTQTAAKSAVAAKTKTKAKSNGPIIKNVAVAVLFTTAPKPFDWVYHKFAPESVEAAAVLLRSSERVLRQSSSSSGSRSSGNVYNITYLAMVTPEIDPRWIRVIERVGYTIKHLNVPISVEEISKNNKALANMINLDGRLGINEMTKIEPLLFGSDYHRVLVLDFDIFFHSSYEHLFDASTLDDDTVALGWTPGGVETEPMNGGFLLYNPRAVNATNHRDNVLDILRKGDKKPTSGWGGTRYGKGGFGGSSMQGLLPYYFLHVLNGTASKRLDRCKYNNMDQLEPCKNTPYRQVVSNHFTGGCVKPWSCFVENAVVRRRRGRRRLLQDDDDTGASSAPRAIISGQLKTRASGGKLMTPSNDTTSSISTATDPRQQHQPDLCTSFKEAWWEQWTEMAKEFDVPTDRCGTLVAQHLYDNLL